MTPRKVGQTVTREGVPVMRMIEGVLVRPAVTQQDDRGTLCEIYSSLWSFDDIAPTYAYAVTIRPGRVKGWAIHRRHVDRYFFFAGSINLVLFDDRERSPTRGLVNTLCFSEMNRSLVSVPAGVYHAVENLGQTDAVMFNLPSEPYNHEDPDKWVLPLENDLIPYSFNRGRGG